MRRTLPLIFNRLTHSNNTILYLNYITKLKFNYNYHYSINTYNIMSDKSTSNNINSTTSEKGAKKEKKKGADKFKSSTDANTNINNNNNNANNQSSDSNERKTPAGIIIPDTPAGKLKDLSKPMLDAYHPIVVEDAWDSWWESEGLYQPDESDEKKDKFIMVIPPPNVTGTLHLGHALMISIEDALTRYHRMKGKITLWLPGTDHAGIATQTVVEKKIARETQKTRHDLGREAFIAEVWKWKEKSGNRIYDQFRRLGASVDWSRDAFTMSPELSKAVKEAFLRLHSKGLIYRANRIVSWCCQLRTAISSIEVETTEFDGPTLVKVPGYSKPVEVGVLHSFAYKLADGTGEIIVATTRIETMLGDTAVAVNSKDGRYKSMIGKKLIHPFVPERNITIITDDILVDMSFGTGAVKVTPAHDPNDFKCGERNNLESIVIFSDDGLVTSKGGSLFVGKKRFDVREEIIVELTKLGLYRGKTANKMAIGFCSRSKDIIEPLVKPQWWVNCKDMANKAVNSVREGKLKLIPNEFDKIWYQWLENIQDWCISRQLWWGHRIPAYKISFKSDPESKKIDDEKHWVVANTIEEARIIANNRFNESKSDDIELTQDEDVLDTWFSSGLFPFSTMGWPNEQSLDLMKYYPGTLLETGHDILFFWVARMVMMGLELTGKLPFEFVYLHALVRDRNGKKMSKSLGNVIDPIDVIHGIALESLHEQIRKSNLDATEVKRATENQKKEYPEGISECGADALRFGLLSYAAQGRDINLDIQKVVVFRQFGNKLWQATRFALLNFDSNFIRPKSLDELNSIVEKGANFGDKWILSRLANAVSSVTNNIEGYHFSEATMAIHAFWLYELCDVYLEIIKPLVKAEDLATNAEAQARKTAALAVLYTCLDNGLRLLHPFMPFITEELYHRLPGFGSDNPTHLKGTGGRLNCGSIMVSNYPEVKDFSRFSNSTIESQMQLYSEIGKAARSTRASLGLTKKRVDLYCHCTSNELMAQINSHSRDIGTIATANKVIAYTNKSETPQGAINSVINPDLELFIPLKGLVDFGGELVKLEKNIENLEAMIERTKQKIQGVGFEKSAEEVKVATKNKLITDEMELKKLSANYENFQGMMSSEEIQQYLTEKINLLTADANKLQASIEKLKSTLPAEKDKQPKKIVSKIEEQVADLEKINKKIEQAKKQQAERANK